MIQFSSLQTRLMRSQHQRLGINESTSACSVSQVVQDVCGLQAQDTQAAFLGVRARSFGLTAADVEKALYQERSVVHTWCMRGTLHFISTPDLNWMLPIFGPLFLARDLRRSASLGLDENLLVRGVDVIQDALTKRGPLTKQELALELQKNQIPSEGQAPIHLIYRAALEGLVCVVPRLNGKSRYALLEDWIGPLHPFTRQAALRELALRYLAAYAPARLEDLAYWSGLSLKDARLAWELVSDQTVQVEAAGQPAWMLAAQNKLLDPPSPSQPCVRLLPKFDTSLLAYANRDLELAPAHQKRILPGGGIIHAVIMVDGRAAGRWDLKRRKKTLQVMIEPFEDFSDEIKTGIATEVADIGRFLGEETISVFR